MNKKWHIIKEYFLISWIIVFGLLIIVGLFNVTNLEELIASFFIFGLIGVFMSILNFFKYLKHEKFRPKKIKELLTLHPFSNFKIKGFKQEANNLRGAIRGYLVFVGIEWENHQKKPNYYLRVLYNPYSYGKLLSFEEFIKVNDTNPDYYNDLHSLNRNYSKKEFSKVTYRDLLREINKMIDHLILTNMKPISYVNWNKSTNDIQQIKSEYLDRYI